MPSQPTFPDQEPVAGAPVAVGWYLNPIEAHIAKGLLESEGLTAFLDTVNHATTNWPITLALGGIRLFVPPSEAERAAEILRSVEPLEEELGSDACPKCGSSDTVPSEGTWKLSLLSSHVLGIPLPFTRKVRRCSGCGETWKPTT